MSERMPQGGLTATQHEILEAVWASEPDGITVGELWRAGNRSVTRTTVQNLMERLHRRGWLRLVGEGRGNRYVSAIDRTATDARLVGGFIDEFFGGAADKLVHSLLGAQRLTPEQVRRLRSVLDDHLQREEPS